MNSSMLRWLTLAGAFVGPACTSPLASAVPGQQRCEAFSQTLSIPNVTVVSTQHYSSQANITVQGLVASCASMGTTFTAPTDLCRVVVNVATSPSSQVRLEAWLPDSWEKRLLSTGTGGIGGCIERPGLQMGSSMGFAALGTNAGHDGSAGYDFFLGHPETIVDFGHRAIHVEAVVGRQLAAQYYAAEPAHSYYAGCSTGGRQGFTSALLYPDDFDGVLLGAAAVDWLHIVASKAVLAQRLGWPDLTSPRYIPPSSWRAIEAAMRSHLDPLDGVVDGIIDEPHSLDFDFALLGCASPTPLLNATLCLTDVQVDAIRSVYQPVQSSAGRDVLPSFDYGSTTDVFSRNQSPAGVANLTYRVLDDYWRGAIYNDSTWASQQFNLSQMDFAVQLNPGLINYAGGVTHDLSKFRGRGGKLLAYHGTTDETVTSGLALRTYDRVAETMGGLDAAGMQEFYRLFYVPGHNHCNGGLGAWTMGQTSAYNQFVNFGGHGKFADRRHSLLMAMVAWVEHGVAPDYMVGTKFENDDVISGQVAAQRRQCPWPHRSKWNQVGDTTEEGSWECILPDEA
ncbi:hypothetical protein PpBr36_07961 [Pyricularia pennisetigena]|uniref:hypothetical protein n=1 Tax=Pyricularia pennisetigena TaxID=1578925 RepID=UPI001150D55A|nr:hypothetical protein PpBr36_07961 [Pyricularia pennisetigena]TLS25623.1 hypothetical protein PpBr36_07961 [Pyricularia pennisetigena]